MLIWDYMQQAKGKHADHVKCQGEQKLEEVAIVSATNAVVDPWAVMIKYLATKSKKLHLNNIHAHLNNVHVY